jgi:hypothetical protein
VWPDASAEGAAAAAAAEPALIAELDQPDEWEPRTDWFMREMPISMETVVENVSAACRVLCAVCHGDSGGERERCVPCAVCCVPCAVCRVLCAVCHTDRLAVHAVVSTTVTALREVCA